MTTARTLTFADLLRHHRHTAGLSQEELAERAGLSRNGISELERGLKRAPRKDTIARLADALQLAAAERATFEGAGRGWATRDQLPPQTLPTRSLVPATLVGRERELSNMEDFLAGARDNAQLLFVAGEPGIGKSRMLRETAENARATGWVVLEGGCQRRAGQPPFAPLLDALARHVAGCTPAQLRADLHGASWLVRLLPELADLQVVPAPRWALPPDQERRLMFAAVARYLANIAGPSGTLVVLDDLQWAGSDALDLLGALVSHARSASGRPLLLLGSYRSTEVHPDHPLSHLLADMARDGLADELPLGPLMPSESRSVLEGLLAHVDGHAALVDRLLERAGGNPFYLVSCARAVLAQAEHGSQVGLSADEVPWDAAQSIRQRIALLPPAAAGLLGSAAVAGRRVDLAMLEALAGWLGLEHRTASEALAAALHARLLLEDGDAAYRFAHDLIREVAAADLGAWQRRGAHREIAEALEIRLTPNERDEHAAELALHFAQGGEVPRALPYLELAGEQARTLYANAEAERIYRMLMHHYEALGRPVDAARCAEQLSRVLITLARHEEALAVLLPAANAYREAGDLDGYCRAMAAIGRVHATSGEFSVGISELVAVLSALETEQPTGGIIAICTSLAFLYWIAVQYGEVKAVTERAMKLVRALNDDTYLPWVEGYHGVALVMLGRLQEAIEGLETVLPGFEQRGDAETLGTIVGHLVDAYACVGRMDRSLSYVLRMKDMAEQMEHPIALGYAWYWLGLHAFYSGDWQLAHRYFEDGCALASRLEHPIARDAVLSYPVLGLGKLCWALGEMELGHKHLEEALTIGRRGLPPRLLQPVLGCLAERDLVAGHPDTALGHLEPLLQTPRGREGIDATSLLPLLAWAYLEAGNVLSAEEVARESLERCRTEHHQLALLDALRVQALLAIRRERWDEAAAALDEVIVLARSMPYPYAEAKVLYVYGRLEAGRGEYEQARERYEQARAICQRLGEVPYRQQIERSLAAL